MITYVSVHEQLPVRNTHAHLYTSVIFARRWVCSIMLMKMIDESCTASLQGERYSRSFMCGCLLQTAQRQRSTWLLAQQHRIPPHAVPIFQNTVEHLRGRTFFTHPSAWFKSSFTWPVMMVTACRAGLRQHQGLLSLAVRRGWRTCSPCSAATVGGSALRFT